VQKTVRRAEKAGTLKTSQQMGTSSVALIVAGVKTAKQEGKSRINVRHVKKGLREHLALAYRGDRPPHTYLFDSVISRQELLSESEPLFEKFQKASEEAHNRQRRAEGGGEILRRRGSRRRAEGGGEIF
jgi:hypothetical protein